MQKSTLPVTALSIVRKSFDARKVVNRVKVGPYYITFQIWMLQYQFWLGEREIFCVCIHFMETKNPGMREVDSLCFDNH